VIDREEFKKIMALMRSFNRQGATHKDGLRIGLKVGQPVENGGVVEFFFGNDGNGPLHYDKFAKFLKDLHDEIIRLEFSHYDVKSSKTIPAKDLTPQTFVSGYFKRLKTRTRKTLIKSVLLIFLIKHVLSHIGL
jgi:hypothetical protein